MSTKYAYEYGKRWNVKTPRDAIGWVVDSYHVGDCPNDIVAEIERRIEASPQSKDYTASIRKQCVQYALLRHAANRKLYRTVMGG